MDEKLQKQIDEYNARYKRNHYCEEYFECDCHSKDDLIVGRVWSDKDKDFTFYEMDLYFKVSCNDSQYVWYSVDPSDPWHIRKWDSIRRFFVRMKWRISLASRMLFKGRIEYEGAWTPARTFNDDEKDIYSLYGYETTMRLADWLKLQAEFIKAKYEEHDKKEKV